MDNKALYKLSYGLFVLTAKEGGKDNGCIINTAVQTASDPCTVSISVNKGNFTHDMLMRTDEFNISVISRDATFDLFKRFGFASGADTDKFSGFDCVKRADNGILYVTEGTNAFFGVKIESRCDMGSHTLFSGTVTDMEVLSDARSATYEYYFDNIKPKPEKTAANETVWRCKVCGYEYKGEDMPDDFVCPLCKHPKSDFEKVNG